MRYPNWTLRPIVWWRFKRPKPIPDVLPGHEPMGRPCGSLKMAERMDVPYLQSLADVENLYRTHYDLFERKSIETLVENLEHRGWMLAERLTPRSRFTLEFFMPSATLFVDFMTRRDLSRPIRLSTAGGMLTSRDCGEALCGLADGLDMQLLHRVSA